LTISDYEDTCCYGRLWIDKEDRRRARIRGIVYACIMAFLGIFQIISTVKTAFCDPGGVPKVTMIER